MLKKRLKILGCAAAISAFVVSSVGNAYAGACTNETWHRIEKRGKIIVGVKADYKPWGFIDKDGRLVGMEADMAKEVADTMGVGLELVGVESSNRMQFLEEGKIDLMIATMSDRPDRRKLVGVVLPNYYSSGTNIMAPKALHLTKWTQLRGKPVCGKQGAFYNKILEDRYGAKIVAFAGNAEAKQALRDRKCVAWVYDDSSIKADLASGQYANYEMPLKTEDENPWAIAVPLAERDCILGRFMSGMAFNWLQSGHLIALEKKWGIQQSSYLIAQKRKFQDWLQEQK